jgi:DNA-binding ferritin-like protein
MAIVQKMVDDIDGTDAHREFTFAVDGTHYALHLHEDNIKGFHAAVDEYVEKARKLGKPPTASASKNSHASGSVRASREQTAAIREAARRAGHIISDRGRIPAHVLKAYHEGSLV